MSSNYAFTRPDAYGSNHRPPLKVNTRERLLQPPPSHSPSRSPQQFSSRNPYAHYNNSTSSFSPSSTTNLLASQPPRTPSPLDLSQESNYQPYQHETTRRVVSYHIGSSYGPYAIPQVTRQPSLRQEKRLHDDRVAYNHGPAASSTLLYDEKDDLDDGLHQRHIQEEYSDNFSCTIFSLRGWLNMSALIIMAAGLIGFFAGYPITSYFLEVTKQNAFGFGMGGINGTGQVPDIPNLPSMIDPDTPEDVKTRTGFDGQKYQLVFSDEFNQDGRTFWPGDDPFWEAADLHYHATTDLEYYDPGQITTQDGQLVITITDTPMHGLNYTSGMLTSWSKMCFQGGYVEVMLQNPQSSAVQGFWPGAWLQANLVRPGYTATSEGVWPYSYAACDVGTLPNQTNPDGATPAAALEHGAYGDSLSYQPGQRMSACTCKGEDHAGPDVSVGRGGPEIDMMEAQIGTVNGKQIGTVSQSAQIAPFDSLYAYRNTTPYAVIYNDSSTHFNDYTGGVYQEAVSAVSHLPDKMYKKAGGFATVGVEWHEGQEDGFATWQVDGEPTWTLNAAAIGPNADVEVSQRLISEEPMALVLNLAISQSFQQVDFEHMQFPNTMKIDYVRVWQREGEVRTSCDPPDHPTMKYIQNHLNAYSNPNLTTWAAAGYTFPKNRLKDDC